MQIMSWNYLVLIAIALCSLAAAVPVPQELSLDAPNPVALEVSINAICFIADIKIIQFNVILQDTLGMCVLKFWDVRRFCDVNDQ